MPQQPPSAPLIVIRHLTGKAKVFLTNPSNTSNMLGLLTTYLNDMHKFTEYEIRIFQAIVEQTLEDVEQTLEDVSDQQVALLTFGLILDTSLMVIWTTPANGLQYYTTLEVQIENGNSYILTSLESTHSMRCAWPAITTSATASTAL